MKDNLDNIMLLSDSYKVTHWKQYPEDTQFVYSYFESRGSDDYTFTRFFGLQYLIRKYLTGKVVTEEKINFAKAMIDSHLGPGLFNEKGWRYILDHYGGRLPVKIKAVAEGTIMKLSNVLMTIENTDPEVPWLTNWLETLLVQVWYPTTIATNSRVGKDIIGIYLEDTGDPEGLLFKLHDFGFRGSTSVESSAIGGAAHLTNFLGTDTMSALVLLSDYYKQEPEAKAFGFSIPASEHSTITSWFEEHEVDAFKNMLEQYPTGLVACVSDSYDIRRACKDYWGTQLRDMVIGRGGTLVVRPDSGDPVEITLEVVEILGEKFGYERNEKNFKVLDPHVRMIQGDGIDVEAIDDILWNFKKHGWSADNIAFGSGGGLLQKFDRDTLRFAFKCSAINRAGEWFDVLKRPATDSSKNSKGGRLDLIKTSNGYETVKRGTSNYFDLLSTVFENGEAYRFQHIENIRNM